MHTSVTVDAMIIDAAGNLICGIILIFDLHHDSIWFIGHTPECSAIILEKKSGLFAVQNISLYVLTILLDRFSIIVKSKVIIVDLFVIAAAALLTKARTEQKLGPQSGTSFGQLFGCFGATETISDL